MSDTTFDMVFASTQICDPWSQYSNWQSVRTVREEWMRMMGLSEEEIAEHCVACPPTDLDEEIAQYNAMFDIQEMNQRT